ncbi:IS3 family transposase [Salipaludibacillus sp. CF4.18]
MFFVKNQKVGALQIKMILENDHSVVMNQKKIRRLMKKFSLETKLGGRSLIGKCLRRHKNTVHVQTY